MIKILAGAIMMLAFTFTAQAQNSRSFVATTGSDANNCTASAYCRTFTAALAVTNPGGEIVVVNSGGYGPATITQPVTIVAKGIDAAITQTATSGNALTISTTGNVTITGLSLYGGGTGNDGILVNQVGFLRLYDMHIQGFASDGVHFTASGGNFAIYNSKINDSGHDGLLLQATGSRAYVNGTDFDNNIFAGADSAEGDMSIADSSAHYNKYGFFANGGTMALYNDRAIFNVNGLGASDNSASKLYFTNCLVSDNTHAYNVGAAGILAGSSPATSLITPGQGAVGTLSAATNLN